MNIRKIMDVTESVQYIIESKPGSDRATVYSDCEYELLDTARAINNLVTAGIIQLFRGRYWPASMLPDAMMAYMADNHLPIPIELAKPSVTGFPSLANRKQRKAPVSSGNTGFTDTYKVLTTFGSQI